MFIFSMIILGGRHEMTFIYRFGDISETDELARTLYLLVTPMASSETHDVFRSS